MFSYHFAVELGSQNTVIYKSGVGIVLKEPSLIAIHNDGKRKILKCVGSDAKALIGKTGQGIEVFEPIVEGVIINKQLVSLMLREFFKKIDYAKLSKLKVAFCVPVGMTGKERNNLLNLAYGLNFYTVSLIPSGIASLVGMGVDVTVPESHLVVSIGGGVSDIALVTAGNIVRGGSVTIAGKSLGQALDAYLRSMHTIMITEQTRSEMMKELVSLYENDRNSLTVWGLDIDTKNRKEITLHSQEFYPIVKNFFTQLSGCIETLVNLSSSEVISDITKSGAYVCGGLCTVAGLEKFLRENLKLPIHLDSDPALTTIYGMGAIIENEPLFELAVSNFK